jgi:hypothetical protein
MWFLVQLPCYVLLPVAATVWGQLLFSKLWRKAPGVGLSWMLALPHKVRVQDPSQIQKCCLLLDNQKASVVLLAVLVKATSTRKEGQTGDTFHKQKDGLSNTCCSPRIKKWSVFAGGQCLVWRQKGLPPNKWSPLWVSKYAPFLQGQCYPLLGAFLYDNKKFVGLNVWVAFAHGVSTPYESMKPIMNYTFINQWWMYRLWGHHLSSSGCIYAYSLGES